MSSHACVSRVRRAYGLKRVGHGGTLDPAVTGVLPIALGPATRLLPYLSGEKTYRGVIQLGLVTNTDDLAGEVIDRKPWPQLTPDAIEAALDRFRGTILQTPPQVSAVHVNGQRAYKLARAGEAVDLAPRTVTIERLQLLAWTPDQGQLEVNVCCSAGTYIRSLARDLGAVLGCGGCLAQLRRTGALGFGLDQAVTLDQLEAEPPVPPMNPLEALSHLPQHQLESDHMQGWRCGRLQSCTENWSLDTPVVVLTPAGGLAGMARVCGSGQLQPRLVLDAAG